MAERLSTLLEREHRQIDAGIEEFIDGPPKEESSGQEAMRAIDALRRHIYLEEEFLFLPLRASGLIPPVLVMLREHGQIWRLLDEVAALIGEGIETVRGNAASSCWRSWPRTTARKSRSSTRGAMRCFPRKRPLNCADSSIRACCRRIGSAPRPD